MVHLSAWSHDQLFFYISQTTATQWLLILIYFIFLIVLCSHYNDLTIFTKHIKLCLPLPRLYDLIKKYFIVKQLFCLVKFMIFSFLYSISFSFSFDCVRNIPTVRWVEILLFETHSNLCGSQVSSQFAFSTLKKSIKENGKKIMNCIWHVLLKYSVIFVCIKSICHRSNIFSFI